MPKRFQWQTFGVHFPHFWTNPWVDNQKNVLLLAASWLIYRWGWSCHLWSPISLEDAHLESVRRGVAAYQGGLTHTQIFFDGLKNKKKLSALKLVPETGEWDPLEVSKELEGYVPLGWVLNESGVEKDEKDEKVGIWSHKPNPPQNSGHNSEAWSDRSVQDFMGEAKFMPCPSFRVQKSIWLCDDYVMTMWWLCDLSTNLSSLDIAHMSKKSKTSPWPDSGRDLCQRRCPPATSAPTPRLRAGESPGFHEQIQYPYNTEPLKFLVYGYTVWVPFRIFFTEAIKFLIYIYIYIYIS